MKLYITTPKNCADEILMYGLTSENCGSIENLPFLILRNDKPQVITGHAAYFEMEIDENDPKLTQVNRVQYEYQNEVSVSSLTAIAFPPETADEVMEAVRLYGAKSPEFNALWDFHTLIQEELDAVIATQVANALDEFCPSSS